MKTMVKLLEMTQPEVLVYVAECLRAEVSEGTLHLSEDYIYFDTGNPICLMAHADTVRIKEVVVSMDRLCVTNSAVGEPLGADDRAGVYGCLKAYFLAKERGFALPSILITTDEEIGGLGARKFVADDVFNNEDTRLVLALDRQGVGEYVTYTPQPVAVADYVESFGFTKKHGSYNDVLDLNCAYSVPGVNVSVGYYGQHTGRERLHMDELFLTINRLVRICADPIPVRYQLPAPYNWRANRGKSQGAAGGNGYQYGGTYGDYYDDIDWGHGNSNHSYEAAPIENDDYLDRYDKIDSFVELNTAESVGHGRIRMCLGCKVRWTECTCGIMLKVFREECSLTDRGLVSDYWLLDSDKITAKFNDELLEDLVEDQPGASGEEEADGNKQRHIDNPTKIKEVLH